MGYRSGSKILPEELLALIQQYVEGECVYIPRAKENCRAWGEANNTRKALEERNREIYSQYQMGTSVKRLSEIYCISTQGIYKILSRQKEK